MRAKLSCMISVLLAVALGGCLAAYEPTERTSTESTVAPLASTSASGSAAAAPSASSSETVAPPSQLTATGGVVEPKLERPPPHPALPDPAAENPEGQSDVTVIRR